MKTFALIGAAGYIAERHMRAIKETGNQLKIAFDPFDVMGRIDSYFLHAEFTKTFEQFKTYIQQQAANGTPIDYITICTPNHTHFYYIMQALKLGCNVICEKPLVINPEHLPTLAEAETRYNKKINVILQLRHHPEIIKLKKIVTSNPATHYHIKLNYITTRGPWYFQTWKADPDKSGGLMMNIGVHFFDMLNHIFGPHTSSQTLHKTHNKATGILEYHRATVEWVLSIDPADIPANSTQRTIRTININGSNIEFSNGFTNLHTLTYQNIIAGNGYGIADTQTAINLVNEINNQPATPFRYITESAQQ